MRHHRHENFVIKQAWMVLVVLIACIELTAPAIAADDEGAADHPLVSRYPGQEIRWYTVENFLPYKVPVGPVTGYRAIGDMFEIHGRVTRIFYLYEGTDRTHIEIWKNFVDALKAEDFTILGQGAPTTRAGQNEVGGRTWQGVALMNNPWNSADPDVGTLTQGSASQGGSAAVVAKKERPAGTVYVVINIEQHTRDVVGTLVDIIEIEDAETGLVVVDADAIGEDIVDYGRVVLSGILFEFDKANLKPESKPALDAIAEHLAAHPDKNFYVVGHTDSKGTFAHNNKLSDDRARAVVDALRKNYGIAPTRLEPHGVGPLVPVYTNATDEGRNVNRRVELVER